LKFGFNTSSNFDAVYTDADSLGVLPLTGV